MELYVQARPGGWCLCRGLVGAQEDLSAGGQMLKNCSASRCISDTSGIARGNAGITSSLGWLRGHALSALAAPCPDPWQQTANTISTGEGPVQCRWKRGRAFRWEGWARAGLSPRWTWSFSEGTRAEHRAGAVRGRQ